MGFWNLTYNCLFSSMLLFLAYDFMVVFNFFTHILNVSLGCFFLIYDISLVTESGSHVAFEVISAH